MTIQELKEKDLLLFNCISGSHAYGLNTPDSDIDHRGVFIAPEKQFFGLQTKEQVNDQKNDQVYYELQKFMGLLVKNNPNILELLNMPEDCIVFQHPLFEQLQLEDFLSKKCKHTFAGYAIAQIKKARGLNKKIVNPMEEERKSVLHFCYVQYKQGAIPALDFLKQNDWKQEHCGLVNITHMKDLYALFYNENAHYSGIITGPKANDISLSSVTKNETAVGVLYFNKDGYSTYCKEYWQYWDWVGKRNESRYQNTLAHGKRYDAKNMMHTFRLLYMAEEIATKGSFNVRRTEDRDFLLKIRSGAFEYDELVEKAEQKLLEIDQLFDQSTLPPSTDPAKANELLFRIRKEFYVNR